MLAVLLLLGLVPKQNNITTTKGLFMNIHPSVAIYPSTPQREALKAKHLSASNITFTHSYVGTQTESGMTGVDNHLVFGGTPFATVSDSRIPNQELVLLTGDKVRTAHELSPLISTSLE